MLKSYLLIFSLLVAPLFVIIPSVAAVDVFEKGVCERGGTSEAAVCKDKDLRDSSGNTQNPVTGPDGIITSIINILSLVVGIVALIVILLAGLKFITSGNNPQDVTNARERVIYALVALVIAALAQVFVRFIIGKVSFL